MLPLDVSDAVGNRLVIALLRQARATARELAELTALCRRVLARAGDGWTQCLAAPESGLLPSAMAVLPPFSWSGDRQPVRVRLAVDGAEIALAESDGKRWPVRGLPIRAIPFPFDREVTGGLIVDGNEVERCVLPGGGALDDGPWVFEAEPDADRLRFVGHGSRAAHAETRLFLAVPRDRGRFEVRSGSMEPRGPIAGADRILHEIVGDVLWRDDGAPAPLRLRIGGADGPSGSIALEVRRPGWNIVAALASIGPPTVSTASRNARLLWRLRGRDWAALPTELPPGAADLALIAGDEILDQRRVVVLPVGADLRCRREDGRYVVEARNLGALAAALPGATAEPCADGWRFTVAIDGPPPASLTVTTRHSDGLELRHHVRVPMPEGGFIDGDGRALPLPTRLAVSAINPVVARGGAGDDRPELEIRLTAPADGPLAGVTLGRVVAFVEDLPLARLRADVRRMQATADARDGEVSLSVLRQGIPGPALRLAGFDIDLRIDPGAELTRLRDRAARDLPPPTGAALMAFCLSRPSDPPLRLADDGARGWRLPGTEQAGPWLVYGAEALAGRVRSRVWVGTAATSGNSLALAAGLAESAARDRAFGDALAALAADPFAETAGGSWDFLEGTLDAAEQVPAGYFDVLARVVETPAVLVHWLLRADERRLAHLAALEDELPFSWVLMPLGRWREAARAARDFYRRHGLDHRPILADRLERIVSLCSPGRGGVWAARDELQLPQAENTPENLARAHAMAPVFAQLAGHDPGQLAWTAEVRAANDWTNLSEPVRRGAAHVAAQQTVMPSPLPPRCVAAIRFCRHAAPDDFDSRYLSAVFHHLVQAEKDRE